MGTAGGSIENTVNQSGLSVNFVPGVKDSNTYIAGNPTHATLGDSNGWASRFGPTLGDIDDDLGASKTLESMVLWNQ